ncbi:hypothetical protein [Sphingobacterium spiritivorum]|uniref:hypothetical protein n=1 Tax=Sphingobacterium spiritivorum TaxID=258 RepID=UPI00191B0DD2|nr:hypothetical protein [Sphingobacterium spiritivorum]QQT25851.1 hypothetical protein I6J02_19420 [Sphingobacterium spiritivorum]
MKNYGFLLICLFFLSCSKKDIYPVEQNTDKLSLQQTLTASTPYYFDWESETYLPSLSTTNLVPLPWNSGTTSINPNFVDDYKKVDGWVLCYNTFSPTVYLNDPNYTYYFALYNRYSGILRFYHWIPANPIATSYVTHGLSLYGNSNNSSMLNFNAVEVIPKEIQRSFSLMNEQQVTLSGGSWYVFDYEMAYDKNIVNSSFPNVGIELNPKWVNVTTVNINGTSTGKIEGTIGNPGSPFNLVNFLTKSVTTLYGNLAYTNLIGVLTSKNGSASSSAEGEMKKTLSDGGKGIVKGILNGMFGLGGSPSTYQKVKLTTQSDIKLNGTMVNNGSLFNIKLAVPGQANYNNVVGLKPNFNEVMGIFNLSSAPVIDARRESFWYSFVDDQYGEEDYTEVDVDYYSLKNDAYAIEWNPAVINSDPVNGAKIENLTTQIVSIYPYSTYNSSGVGFTTLLQKGDWNLAVGANFEVLVNGNHVREQNGKDILGLSLPNSSEEFIIVKDKYAVGYPGEIGVRIIFDVVPNNGGKRTKIIKTFAAKIRDVI